MAEAGTIRRYEKVIRESSMPPRDFYLSRHMYSHVFFLDRGLCVSPIPGRGDPHARTPYDSTCGLGKPASRNACKSQKARDVMTFPGSPTAPVLLIIFNRPDTTRKVLETISRAAPSRLFVAADGPRDGSPSGQGALFTGRWTLSAVGFPGSATSST